MKIKILQKKYKNQLDSYWYDGDIATITKGDIVYTLEACGDTKILHYDKKGNVDGHWFNGKDYDNFPMIIQDDKDLTRVSKSYRYAWSMNNWLEVTGYNKKTKKFDSVIGDVAGNYDDGIELLKNYAKEDIYKEL